MPLMENSYIEATIQRGEDLDEIYFIFSSIYSYGAASPFSYGPGPCIFVQIKCETIRVRIRGRKPTQGGIRPLFQGWPILPSTLHIYPVQVFVQRWILFGLRLSHCYSSPKTLVSVQTYCTSHLQNPTYKAFIFIPQYLDCIYNSCQFFDCLQELIYGSG